MIWFLSPDRLISYQRNVVAQNLRAEIGNRKLRSHFRPVSL
jgi:hypothetical protein